ncbi:hypothetical protein [Leifsonia sp. TF02-11]|uniref:hypothetical protein n=1 Tax=Leifsonia sp. TF02-11 TaxID=2815212 RepID=UPI001AA17B0D|nr:hypothetical protein [Leifsonia sp. TF02-11]MBO1741041.1 hypothetical protein [Leifsonia sp. TF02-11]
MPAGGIKEWLTTNAGWIATVAIFGVIMVGVLIGLNTSNSGGIGSTVQSAQTIYKTNHGSYGTADQLTAAGVLTVPDGTKVSVAVSGDGAAFCAVAVADGGKPMWTYSGATRSADTIPTVAGVTCPAAP